MDAHIYRSHIEGVKLQLTQDTYDLPTIETPKFTSIFDWEYTDTILKGYKSSNHINKT